jgi:squalene-associated FAD-dependent desaturase
VKHVVVVGGGWAGCAAAVALARAGCKVTLLEAARTLGGRARVVDVHGKQLDNGQHILLGAYSATLGLLRQVGIDPAQALLHLPLQMCYPDDVQGMHFVAPRLPAPMHVGLALIRARGLSTADKMALARFSTSARWMDWTLYHDCSVTELLERFEQTGRITRLLWRPLCLAALNTAPERASARVFLNVLRDSLGARRAASDMLLPRRDLSALFPDAAARLLEAQGASVRLGAKVTAIAPAQDGWRVDASGSAVGGNWTVYADAVVLATAPSAGALLLDRLDLPGLSELSAQLLAFEHEPITTCYLQYNPALRLARPFYALLDDAAHGAWGQFVFDRGQLDAAQAGLLAVVISASSAAAALGQAELARAVAAQLAQALGQAELAQPQWCQVITEKRATFACTPDLLRPANASGAAGLVLAGDYTASDYPATLEAAVRSGLAAAAALA